MNTLLQVELTAALLKLRQQHNIPADDLLVTGPAAYAIWQNRDAGYGYVNVVVPKALYEYLRNKVERFQPFSAILPGESAVTEAAMVDERWTLLVGQPEYNSKSVHHTDYGVVSLEDLRGFFELRAASGVAHWRPYVRTIEELILVQEQVELDLSPEQHQYVRQLKNFDHYWEYIDETSKAHAVRDFGETLKKKAGDSEVHQILFDRYWQPPGKKQA